MASLLNGPARLSRKTIRLRSIELRRTGKSEPLEDQSSLWRATPRQAIQAGKRQVKNNAQSNLLVICIICGSEARTLNPGTDT